MILDLWIALSIYIYIYFLLSNARHGGFLETFLRDETRFTRFAETFVFVEKWGGAKERIGESFAGEGVGEKFAANE